MTLKNFLHRLEWNFRYIYNSPKGEFAPKLLKPQTETSRLYFEKGVSATIKLKSGFPERFDLLHTKESTERRRLVAGEGKNLKELGRLFCGGSPPPKCNDWSNLYSKWWFSKGILPKMASGWERALKRRETALIQVTGRWWFQMFFIFSPRCLAWKWSNVTSIFFEWVGFFVVNKFTELVTTESLASFFFLGLLQVRGQFPTLCYFEIGGLWIKRR